MPRPTEADKIVHRGLRYDRTEGDFTQAIRERAFAEAWQRENDLNPRNYCLLWMLLSEQNDQEPGMYGLRGRKMLCEANQESATVAATVIQWLGSTVGWCFLENAVNAAGYELVPKEQRDGE